MEHQEILARYRSPDRAAYPELAGYSREDIYEDCMGGGALYLAAQMARPMDLSKGQRVLDLGCGKGASSVFLAKHFGVRVVAVDLWTSATFLHQKFAARGYQDRIMPLNLDASEKLPFAEGYFDAIFCMNSLSFYGGSVEFLHRLLKHLKAGGFFCVGMETLNEEFPPEAYEHPPVVYSYTLPPPNNDVNVWEDDFSKMHSPPWWMRLFEDSALLDVLSCHELEDATILYEDLVKYQIEYKLEPEDVQYSIAQIEYGRTNKPYKTLFVITSRKRP